MKVTVYDKNKPDDKVIDNYPVDPLLGPPVVGDEVRLRERAYQTHHFLTATVVKRAWFAVTGEPHETELRLFVDVSR